MAARWTEADIKQGELFERVPLLVFLPAVTAVSSSVTNPSSGIVEELVRMKGLGEVKGLISVQAQGQDIVHPHHGPAGLPEDMVVARFVDHFRSTQHVLHNGEGVLLRGGVTGQRSVRGLSALKEGRVDVDIVTLAKLCPLFGWSAPVFVLVKKCHLFRTLPSI